MALKENTVYTHTHMDILDVVLNITLKQTEKRYFPKLFSTDLRLSRHKSQTALTALVGFFRDQWAAPQGDPHWDPLIILMCHDAKI